MTNSIVKMSLLPKSERPRERLLAHGASGLSNRELVAIVLQTGRDGVSVTHLADEVLAKAGQLRGLLDFGMEELMSVKGIGQAKAAQLLAAIELGRRICGSPTKEKQTIRSPEDVSDLLMDRMRYLDREHFIVLFLDTKNNVLAQETVSMGSLNASIVHPREVFRSAVKKSVASIIAVHNHPSGDPKPSQEDIEVTERLKAAGQLLGIPLLDHVIIGDRCYVSLKQKGYL